MIVAAVWIDFDWSPVEKRFLMEKMKPCVNISCSAFVMCVFNLPSSSFISKSNCYEGECSNISAWKCNLMLMLLFRGWNELPGDAAGDDWPEKCSQCLHQQDPRRRLWQNNAGENHLNTVGKWLKKNKQMNGDTVDVCNTSTYWCTDFLPFRLTKTAASSSC